MNSSFYLFYRRSLVHVLQDILLKWRGNYIEFLHQSSLIFISCFSLICIFISSPVQIYVYIVDILYMQTVLKSCYCYELENWKKTLKKKNSEKCIGKNWEKNKKYSLKDIMF